MIRRTPDAIASGKLKRGEKLSPNISLIDMVYTGDKPLRRMAKKGKKTVRLSSLEDTTMLAQRIERIRDGYIEQGERKGLLEGKRKGEREGKREEAERLFLKIYTVKNGSSAPKDISLALVASRHYTGASPA